MSTRSSHSRLLSWSATEDCRPGSESGWTGWTTVPLLFASRLICAVCAPDPSIGAMGSPLRRTVSSDLARSNSVAGIRSTRLEPLPVAAGSALRCTVSGGAVRATSGTGGPVCAPEPDAAERADAPGTGPDDRTDRPRGGRTLAVANRFAVAGTTSENDRRRAVEPGPPISGPPREVVGSNRAAADAVTGRAAVPGVDSAGRAALHCVPAGARPAASGARAAAAALASDPGDGVVSREASGRVLSDRGPSARVQSRCHRGRPLRDAVHRKRFRRPEAGFRKWEDGPEQGRSRRPSPWGRAGGRVGGLR